MKSFPRLTQTVQKGGCAAKVAALELRQILSRVQFPPPPADVLVDAQLFDDAAVYRINSEIALVQTLDFFTPIVDTPRLFGRIAAANALSDVYAMGGTPKTALAILAFPVADFEPACVAEVLQGASDAVAEAGAALVGGHSIDDDSLKFGLSVTGLVHPERIWSNAQARPGDHLILTKGLGTGTLMAGLKREAWGEDDVRDALDSMGQVNAVLDLLSEDQASTIHAATDITGFGLAGHAMQMAHASKVHFKIDFAELPLLPKTRQALAEGFLTKAHRSNRNYVEGRVNWAPLSDSEALILFDPQTSGGLLLSVAPEKSSSILEALQSRFPAARRIGEVAPRTTETPGDWSLR